MQLIFQYPAWFIMFCLLLAGIYAGVLYVKNKHFFDESQRSKWMQFALAAFRFVSTFLLAFLLLSPFLKSKVIDKVQPVIVLAHDNSQSILLHLNEEDSAAYINSLNSALEAIQKQYNIDYYSFDSKLQHQDTLNFKGNATNISEALNELNGLYFNQNVGAVLLATDGIYNEGINPVYSDFSFPVYAIGLGDTNQLSDLKIQNVFYNKIAYLDDKVQLECLVEASKMNGKSFTIRLMKNGATLQSKTLASNKDLFEGKLNFEVHADKVGMQKYTIAIQEFSNEVTHQNNYFDVYIDVIDNRQKILLVANAPHPDIAAIKSVIDLNKNFELEVQYAQKFSANLDKYNLVILHQLPSAGIRAANVFSTVKNAKMPVWYIGGGASAFAALNQEQNLVQIGTNGKNTNDAFASYNTSFSLFTLNESTISALKQFPPLTTPFGTYNTSPNAQLLMNQKIGAVVSDYPLWVFQDDLGVRKSFLIGDGLWRWKLHDYLEHNNHDAFNELIEKAINYLAVKGDKRKFRVNTNKNTFYEGEVVEFTGELYNDNFELVNEPEVTIEIRNDKGDEFPYTFSKTDKAYFLSNNSLPEGIYAYTAATKFNGKNYTANGQFTIQKAQLEALNTQANHKILKQLSDKTSGKFYTQNQIKQLEQDILALDLKPTLFESTKTRPIINLFGIFFIILALLSLEWFIRKWMGGY